MVADPQQIQTMELQAFIQQKHAIAAFIDVECEVRFADGKVVCQIGKGVAEVVTYANVIELYAGLEHVHGDYIYRWFNKNTIKASIFTSMRYFTDMLKMSFDTALKQVGDTLLNNCGNNESTKTLIMESLQEFRDDTNKALASVDEFNFPDASKN